MPAFAIYRLPYEQSCHLVMQKEGEPEELSSVGMLNSRDGFVVAPSAVDRQHPVLLLTVRDEHELKGVLLLIILSILPISMRISWRVSSQKSCLQGALVNRQKNIKMS